MRTVFSKIYVVTFLLLVSVVPSVQAYLDPGTGSFILQTLIAGFFGAVFVLKSYWASIKSWFAGSAGSSENSAENAADNAASKESSGIDNADNQILPENSEAQVSGAAIKPNSDAKSDEH
ncbi:MAG: hypothetical protein CVV41_12260 [Candidatus Riflebacteria bacterium HGW-Riflebacteria-1]|jgi:hypothetical protein|nr:MAG: hypothetical protein CVV41_12260 [Candidatus Riflebacteria bacterium HGW-Riflebacteria-1]